MIVSKIDLVSGSKLVKIGNTIIRYSNYFKFYVLGIESFVLYLNRKE